MNMRTYRSIAACGPLALLTASTATAGGNLLEFRTIAFTGQQAPGAPDGVVYSGFPSNPTINAAGRVAFRASLSGAGVTSANNEGYWSDRFGSLDLVAREGNQAGGLPSGAVYSFAPFSGTPPTPLLNNNNQIAFVCKLAGSGITASNNSGIWIDTGGTQHMAVQNGALAPTPTPGSTYNGFFADLTLNNNGRIAFRGGLIGQDSAIFSNGFGSMEMVVQVNQSPAFKSLSDHVLSDSGVVAFGSLSQTPNQSSQIWSNQTAPLQQLSSALSTQLFTPVINRTGDIAYGYLAGSSGWDVRVQPGPGSSANPPASWPGIHPQAFVEVDNPVINRFGHAAFAVEVDPPGSTLPTYSGIIADGPNGAAMIVRSDEPAPGALPGENWWGFIADSVQLDTQIAINSHGHIVFATSLTVPNSTRYGDRGLWLKTDAGVSLIFREGSILDVNDDPDASDLRTVQSFFISSSSGGEDGRASSFSDSDKIAVRINFTDGTSGIFVIAVPGPGAVGLLGVAGVIGLRRRRG